MQYLEIIRAVIEKPKRFFSKMPKTGYKEPLMFYMINSIIGAALFALFVPALSQHWIALYGQQAATAIGFVQSVLIALAMAFLWPAMMLLGLKIVGGKSDYKNTFNVNAYTSFTKLLDWIPFVGFLVGIYNIFLKVIGLSKVHKLSTMRTIGGLLIALAIVISAIIVIAILAGIGYASYLFMTNSTLLYPQA